MECVNLGSSGLKVSRLCLGAMTTGVITGGSDNPADLKQTIKINGVLLQNQTNAAGRVPGPNHSGAFFLEKP
jgi:hypothetical protein